MLNTTWRGGEKEQENVKENTNSTKRDRENREQVSIIGMSIKINFSIHIFETKKILNSRLFLTNIPPHRKKSSRRGGGASIAEVFWEITLEPEGRHGPLAEELGNLPAWDSPDVFADSCDLIGKRAQPDIRNILC
jgi:hypothetical protein